MSRHGPFKGLKMKRNWIRIGVIAAVFVISLFVFSVVLNKSTTDMTIDMQAATLPVVSMYADGYEVNLMHGYVNEMNMAAIRDSITPIGQERNVEFIINTYGTGVSGLAYEVRSADGERLIENSDIEDYEQKFNTITGSINVKDLIEEEQEYNLVILLTLSDGRTARYYTRIVMGPDVRAGEKINFIHDFNSKTFDKEQAKELSSYMESNKDGDNTSFGNVDIHSSIDQLSWGDMDPVTLGKVKTTIHEIGEKTASVSMEYMVSVKNGGITNYYRVEEYYRIRQSDERFYLLSFNRSMDEIFTMEEESTANNKIVLGIQSEEVDMMESPDGNVFAFVNTGRLFSYNVTDNKLARLYAFYEEMDVDERNIYDCSKIKIMNVEETGNVSFIVYGYINRGTHEGEAGVLLEYYNSVVNTIEEQVFIPYDGSPQALMADIDKLSYLNTGSNTLYLLIDGAIYAIDAQELTCRRMDEGIREDTLFVSESCKSAIWQSGSRDDTKAELKFFNLEEDTISTVPKGSNECIKPIGFMNEDMIYGVADAKDLTTNVLGDITFPMDKVIIRDSDQNILKEYDFEDVFITEGYIHDNQITLKRAVKNEDGSLSEIVDDQITNNDEAQTGRNNEVSAVTDLYEKISQIEVKSTIDAKTLKFLTPKEVLYEGGRQVELSEKEDKDRFYLYDRGKITGIYDVASDALIGAYEERATVTDNRGNVVYTRGETHARNQIMSIQEESVTEEKNSLALCLDNMLKLQGISRNTENLLANGRTPMEILNDNLQNAYTLNITGAVMDTALYYLNQDIPVLAILENGDAVLLIGYNESNMVWYDPTEGSIYKRGMTESREILEAAGNQFLTYSVKYDQ